jgi:hypothetical protein
MKRYVIERKLPAIGDASHKEFREAAKKSNAALAEIGKDIQWVESYVVQDQTYCVYLAKDEETIRKHAELSGFPANKISEVKRIFDPATASAVTRFRA